MFSDKELKKLIYPLIIEQTLSVTIGMADIMMISGSGEAAVSGVSLVEMINMLLINIFAALSTGGAVVCSHYLGQKNREKANSAAKQLFLVAFFISILIMIIALSARHGILKLAYGQIDREVMENALTFFTISACSYPFIALYNSGAALFRAMGNSKISMLTSLFMNLCNISGNTILLYVFHMGVAGIAISSLSSRILSCIIIMKLLKNQNHLLYVDQYLKIKPNKNLIKKILHIGIPNSFENSFFQLGRILLVSMISTFGTVQIAANAVANTIDYVGCIPAQAIGLAMITVIGRCVGAKDYEQAIFYTKKLMKLAYGISFVLHVSILLSLPIVLHIYQLSEETYQLAMLLVVIHEVCSILLWPSSFTLPCALRASGDVKFTMGISISSMVILRIGLAYIFGVLFGLGAIGVWIGMVADWFYRGTFFIIRFVRGKWKIQII